MEKRAKIPPGLPRANPTISYWQDPPSDIADHRSTPSLPAQTDYIIIGSGISGASIAHNLLLRSPKASVLMLEARGASSGATGRNGGHTKAATYRSFLKHEQKYGVEEAIKIARMEYANIRETHALARDYGIDCASNPCDTVDIIYSPTHLEQGHKAIARMREVMGDDDPAAKYEIFSAEDARAKFLTPDALGAFRYEAGSISAYRFAVGLLKVCLGKGLNLQTNTPALSISEAAGSTQEQQRWMVDTPRGKVEAKEVIVATNGYTAHLLPEMQGLIVPLRGQITAQRPGSGLPQKGLDTTVSFIYETGYEYMITRPAFAPDAGTIVIGGGLGTLPQDGVSEFGNTDDEALNSELSKYLAECTKRFYGDNWGTDNDAGRVCKEWTGIMGTSADGLPYVGPVQGKKGVWISASFNGSGMVLCLKCAEAVVDMILDGRTSDWFPKALQVDEKRLGEKFKGRLNMRIQPPGEAMFQDKGI